MRLLVFFLLSLVTFSLAEIEFDDICYKCSYFNRYGQGFMQHPNSTLCCDYIECWKIDGATTLSRTNRNCPPGTWFTDLGHLGVPCIAEKPSAECLDVCGGEDTVTPTTCHLYPNPANARQFGTLNPPPDGPWEFEGECGEGFVFDHGSCTCISNPESCFCFANILFENDVKDHSCHGGQVVNSNNPVTLVTADGVPTGSAGYFAGPGSESHLTMPMFGGMYDPPGATSCHVDCLSIGVFFKNERFDHLGASLVSYADCAFGIPTYNIFLAGNVLEAYMMDSSFYISGIQTNTWYYASMEYRRKRRAGTLTLTLMNVAQAVECETNCNCDYLESVKISTPPACIFARSCGLQIGHSGLIPDFFQGQIGRVQVSHTCNRMACSGTHCLKKGKRGRKGRWNGKGR